MPVHAQTQEQGLLLRALCLIENARAPILATAAACNHSTRQIQRLSTQLRGGARLV